VAAGVSGNASVVATAWRASVEQIICAERDGPSADVGMAVDAPACAAGLDGVLAGSVAPLEEVPHAAINSRPQQATMAATPRPRPPSR
jgi:hypothetical protein